MPANIDREGGGMQLPLDISDTPAEEGGDVKPEAKPKDPLARLSALSSKDKTHLNLVVLIRNLVLIQPPLALLSGGLSTLSVYILFRQSILFPLCLLPILTLIIYALIEIIRIKDIIGKDGILFAIIYNIVNKGMYTVTIVLLILAQSGENTGYYAIGNNIVHFILYALSLLYKKHKSLEQYVAPYSNPSSRVH